MGAALLRMSSRAVDEKQKSTGCCSCRWGEMGSATDGRTGITWCPLSSKPIGRVLFRTPPESKDGLHSVRDEVVGSLLSVVNYSSKVVSCTECSLRISDHHSELCNTVLQLTDPQIYSRPLRIPPLSAAMRPSAALCLWSLRGILSALSA